MSGRTGISIRYCSIDIETTGLNPETDQVLEFAAVIDDLSLPEPEEFPTFERVIKHKVITGNPYALHLNAGLIEKISHPQEGVQYSEPGDLAFQFVGWLRDNGFELRAGLAKINVAGKNAGTFDIPFLNRMMNWSNHVQANHRFLDPGILYLRPEDEKVPDLAACLERAGLPSLVTHTALSDAMQVMRLIRHYHGRNV